MTSTDLEIYNHKNVPLVKTMSSDEISTLILARIKELKNEIRTLKDCAQQAGVSVVLLGDCFYKLSVNNIDSAICILKEKALPYYQEHCSKMKKCLDDIFTKIYQCVEDIQLLYSQKSEA